MPLQANYLLPYLLIVILFVIIRYLVFKPRCNHQPFYYTFFTKLNIILKQIKSTRARTIKNAFICRHLSISIALSKRKKNSTLTSRNQKIGLRKSHHHSPTNKKQVNKKKDRHPVSIGLSSFCEFFGEIEREL